MNFILIKNIVVRLQNCTQPLSFRTTAGCEKMWGLWFAVGCYNKPSIIHNCDRCQSETGANRRDHFCHTADIIIHKSWQLCIFWQSLLIQIMPIACDSAQVQSWNNELIRHTVPGLVKGNHKVLEQLFHSANKPTTKPQAFQQDQTAVFVCASQC